MNDEVKITIEGEGLSLTKKTNLQKAGQIISFLGYNNERASSIEANSDLESQTLLPKPKRISSNEFIGDSKAKTYAQKITALAYFLKDQSSQENFTPQELKILFKRMGDEPKNFTRDLRTAMELQYVSCMDPIADRYEITEKGIRAVDEKFISSTEKRGQKQKRTIPLKNIRNEIKEIQIKGILDGFPDYYSLERKSDQILWLLEYSNSMGIRSLKASEIEYLSSELKGRIESSGVSALNLKNIKSSFIIKNKDGFEIQKKGIDHLKSLGSSIE